MAWVVDRTGGGGLLAAYVGGRSFYGVLSAGACWETDMTVRDGELAGVMGPARIGLDRSKGLRFDLLDPPVQAALIAASGFSELASELA